MYKRKDESIFSNYRPVAVPPSFSKILQKLMYKRLMKYIQKHSILYRKQYGFRKSHSIEMALVELTLAYAILGLEFSPT